VGVGTGVAGARSAMVSVLGPGCGACAGGVPCCCIISARGVKRARQAGRKRLQTQVIPVDPANPDPATIARAAGVIRGGGLVAAPSANPSNELSPTRAEHVLKGLGGRIEMILDGGPCPGGIESTVVDATGEVVRLLRPGLVTVPMLEAVVGRVEVVSRASE